MVGKTKENSTVKYIKSVRRVTETREFESMSIKSMVRKLDERRERKSVLGRGRSHIAPESPPPLSDHEFSEWSNLPPELLADIILRVDSSEPLWPARRMVVTCAAVCRSWREVTKGIVRAPEECGLITFPISLKQPGPRDHPIQCFIRRDRGTSTYRLYLGLAPVAGNSSKLLLAAKKTRKATETEFRISLASNDSRVNETYVGNLRSNFFGTKFTVCDIDHSLNSTKKVLRRSSLRNHNVASISYELNVLRSRGPRRMHCTMHSIPVSGLEEDCESSCNNKKSTSSSDEPLVLRNKTPRWHDQLQCWCLNFRGRVTVASVKNFQLVAAMEPLEAVPTEEQEKVILQFGKIAKDSFTMDYRYPLSAFQAFAICLSSFDTKPACE